MSANVKRKKPVASTRVKLEDARMAYADQLIVAKAFEAGQQEKFSCSFVMLANNPSIELIEAAVEAAIEARWGEDRKKWPRKLRGYTFDPVIKLCADYPSMGKFPEGACFVRASSADQPGIVGPDVVPIARQDLRTEVYSGRHCNVSLQGFTYERVTGAGASLALGNIQLTKHDERLGTARPKPEEEFDPTELPGDDDESGDEDFEPVRPRRR
jgi:hypothetical protein